MPEQEECGLLRYVFAPRSEEPIIALINVIYSWISKFFEKNDDKNISFEPLQAVAPLFDSNLSRIEHDNRENENQETRFETADGTMGIDENDFLSSTAVGELM